MKWKSRAREAERRLNDLEEHGEESLVRDRETKVYGPGIDPDKLPLPDTAREHLTARMNRVADTAEISGARVIGMDPPGERHE